MIIRIRGLVIIGILSGNPFIFPKKDIIKRRITFAFAFAFPWVKRNDAEKKMKKDMEKSTKKI